MLPVIVTTNLARGARAPGPRPGDRHPAERDPGPGAPLDVLCVDKTGTLTEDRVAYLHSVDPAGRPDGQAAEYAYLAVSRQSAPPDSLDEAIVAQLADPGDDALSDAMFTTVEEIPFHHTRRRATVVVRELNGDCLLITRGDPDEIIPRCTRARVDGGLVDLDLPHPLVRSSATSPGRACGCWLWPSTDRDETGLTLVGFVGFVDPVRASETGQQGPGRARRDGADPHRRQRARRHPGRRGGRRGCGRADGGQRTGRPGRGRPA